MKQTDQIEVFANDMGGITIKQKDCYGDDVVVALWHENVSALVEGLLAAEREVAEAEKAAKDE